MGELAYMVRNCRCIWDRDSVATMVGEYHQLNNRPVVHIYDYGIAVNCTRLHAYGNTEREGVSVKWNDIKEVVHPEPDFIKQRMLGFYVVFSDDNKVLIPQSIEGYLELYSEFSRRGIRGANSPLSFYPMDYTGVMNSKRVTPYKVLEPLK